jgi:hypothetical protein
MGRKWYKNKSLIGELDKRHEAYKRGESKGYTVEEVMAEIKTLKVHRKGKRLRIARKKYRIKTTFSHEEVVERTAKLLEKLRLNKKRASRYYQ